MNKTASIIRIAILSVLFGLAVILLFGEEQDESLVFFFLHMVMDKAMAFALFYSIGRLYKRWCKLDPWIRAYDKMCNDVMYNPNPSKL